MFVIRSRQGWLRIPLSDERARSLPRLRPRCGHRAMPGFGACFAYALAGSTGEAARPKPDRNSSQCSGLRKSWIAGTTDGVSDRRRSMTARASSSRPICSAAHMRQAGRQRAVGRRKARQLIEGCAQRRGGFREPAVDEMSRANPSQMESSSVARVETHRGLEMLDRQIGAAGKHAKPTTPIPSVGRARIEGKARSINATAASMLSPKRPSATAARPRILGSSAPARRALLESSTAIERFALNPRSSHGFRARSDKPPPAPGPVRNSGRAR